jgi:ParB-like chromosome segregation protein Spo0J
MDVGHQVVFQLFGTREHEGKRIREWRAQSGPLASSLMGGGRYSLGADYWPNGASLEIPPFEDFERETELSPFRLPFHPLAATFPLIPWGSVEVKGMVDSIKQHGLRERIVILDGKVIDGRNRLKACEEAGVMPKFRDFDAAKDGEPLAFVLAMNLHRRHLSEGQLALKAEATITTKHGGDRKSKCANAHSIEPVTIAAAAGQWGVKVASVRRATFVREHALPSVVAKVEAGSMTLGRAAYLAKQSDEEQRDAPDVKFAGRTPKPKTAPRTVTAPALRAMTDEQRFALCLRDLASINRGAAREGKEVIVRDIATSR